MQNYYSDMTEEIQSKYKSIKFKVRDRVRITKYKNIFSKGYTENWSKEKFIIPFFAKTNPWMYKIKDLIRKNNKKFLLKRIVAE